MNQELIPKVPGLQFMPVLENKRPIFDEWQTTKKEYDFSRAKAIGLVCGQISDYVQAIDVDLKYDITGKIFDEFKKQVGEIDKNLLRKLTVQSTVSGGYHLIFKCKAIEGNRKLSERYTTEEERQFTFKKTYDKIVSDLKKEGELSSEQIIQKATLVAHNASEKDTIRVLFETRGEGGYIACYPTKGYEIKYGSFDKIKYITEEERDILFSVARSFNEVYKEFKPKKTLPRKTTKGDTPLEDYDKRGDVVSLLEEYGWTAVGKKGSKILLKRPGDTKATHSGNFDEEKNWFSVFSTSTEFEAQTAYRPYAVYCILKCKGDWNALPIMLSKDGYGSKDDDRVDTEIPSIINTADEDDLSFLATEEDYDEYLEKWRTGTFEMGKSTGIEPLDKHFLFKEGNLVIINGIDNTGKSSVVWYLAMLSCMFHGWKWLIFSSENRVGGIIRKLIEFYWSEPIDTMSEDKYKFAKQFVKENFDIIKVSEKMYNYQDILNMTKLAFKKHQYKGLMIDPYNSLKVDIPAKSKNSTYDYHYEAASVIQLFAKKYNISIYLNCHVGTVGARNKDKSGYTKAPQKEDTEMGVMFANKADEFITIHRITQHETEWMYTEFHVRKVKETETGGRVTPFGKPIDFKMVNNLSGFEYISNRSIPASGYNAIQEYHKKKQLPKYTEPKQLQPSKLFDAYTPINQQEAEPPF